MSATLMPETDFRQTTWAGSRRAQHAAHLALPFRRKIELIEEMCALAKHLAGKRKLNAAEQMVDRVQSLT